MEDYLKHAANFAHALFESACPEGTEFFIEKTPRYSIIANEVMELFPHGKFIFLWRNPLAICNSIMETWGQGDITVFDEHMIDFEIGIPSLVNASQRKDRDILEVRYEDFVQDPEQQAQGLCRFTGIPFSVDAVESIAKVQFKTGDPTGQNRYKQISTHGIRPKLKKQNSLRRIRIKNVLDSINETQYGHMGYSKAEILSEFATTPSTTRGLFRDSLFITRKRYRELSLGTRLS